jgi:hypothetical protein
VRRSDLVGFAAIAVCAATIGLVQSPLAATEKRVQLTDDTAALPPPRQLRVMSLGYRSALADLLWAKLLVEQGVRSEQKRTFESLPQYLDGIIELEPDHQTLYQFVDTLVVYKPGAVGTEADARRARSYLERGTRERPYDHEVWLRYGQFSAFLGPSYLSNGEEIERWRTEGAFAIAHAVELGADADRSLAASTLLSKAGESKAAIKQLQNAYALTENPDTRMQIVLKLRRLQASVDVEAAVSVIEQEWRSRYPFLSRGEALLIGPHRDPAACAGPGAYESKVCAADWAGATRDAR